MRILTTTAAMCFALLAGRGHASTVTYMAAIDTSILAGTTGSLDFNLEPGPFGSRPATVQIVSFGGNGTSSGSPTVTGDASGSLPGDLLFDNGTGFNDYFQGLTYGSLLSFDIVLSGPAIGSSGIYGSGSTFAFSLFSDAMGTMPVLTSDTADGYAITVDVNSDGSTTLHNYTNGTVVLHSPAGVTPEPATWVMVATGLLGGVWIMSRQIEKGGQQFTGV